VISERRRQAAEDAYHADNERVRLALNAGALLGSFVWDIKDNVLSGDERFARTFSYPPEQNLADLPMDIAAARIHPDDRSWVQEQIDQSVETGEWWLRVQ
jgi:PAS domain-containing protein